MEQLFDRLCGLLEDELERQENVLAQCLAQQDAFRGRDLAVVSARAEALQALLRQAADAEPLRHDVLRRLVRKLNMPAESSTLSQLIAVAPAPWNARLRHLQGRLHDTLRRSRALARENAVLLRRSLRVVGQCLQGFQPATPPGVGHYTANGRESAALRRPAVLLNQRG